jgi:hypothetical protein
MNLSSIRAVGCGKGECAHGGGRFVSLCNLRRQRKMEELSWMIGRTGLNQQECGNVLGACSEPEAPNT